MQNISLAPGGQLELSGAPLETLHHTSAEIKSHLYCVSVHVGKCNPPISLSLALWFLDVF